MRAPVVSVLVGTILLAGCGTTTTPLPDGRTEVYRISNASQGRVQLRMLDGVNALRNASGLREVRLDSSLNAAAETHSRDMSVQNRPWHFSSDGSSPVERAQRSGYERILLGENISESYETELETLSAWMEQPETRDVIMNPAAEHMGFAYYQEGNGKIWWTLVMGGGGPAVPISPTPPANTAPPPPPSEIPTGAAASIPPTPLPPAS